jgi:hypothetical protein
MSRRPMPHTVLGCQVSKMINSDTCPRPTTGGERGRDRDRRLRRGHGLRRRLLRGAAAEGRRLVPGLVRRLLTAARA